MGPRTIILEGNPTHYVIHQDGTASRVFPQGYKEGEALELPKGYWDTPKIWTGAEWVEDLEGEQARLWNEVKLNREKSLSSNCTTPFGVVQTDPKSLAAIDRKVIAAMSDPEGWSDTWTLADNSTIRVDYAAIIAIKTAVDNHEKEIRDSARLSRDHIFDKSITNITQLRETMK